MKIFIIHSGKDRERVNEQFVPPLKAVPNTRVLLLENGGPLWKWEARRKIKKAQMALCVLGDTSAQSKNIAWEISTAIRYHKCLYILKLDEGAQIPRALYAADDFCREEKLRGKEAKSIEDVITRIQDYEKGKYAVFNKDAEKRAPTEIMEQYKLFLSTSENLVSRRQSVNNFYLTANAVLVSMIAAIGKVKEGDWMAFSWAVLLTSVIGIILSYSWGRLLEAYGTLNACKLKVINQIEESLPLSLFKAEWDVMSDKLNNRRYVSFTENEKRLPAIFIVLYLAAIAVCSITVGIHCFGPSA